MIARNTFQSLSDEFENTRPIGRTLLGHKNHSISAKYSDLKRPKILAKVTKAHIEILEEFETDLRGKYPDLDALDITQLYLVAKLDKEVIRKAYRDLKTHSKVPLDKEAYTVKIPAENALEYSQYLAIVQAFTELRKSNNKINIMMLPQLTNNNIFFDVRSGSLRVNAYKFCESYK